MLTFMHTYTPESWEGLVKNSLFREGDGLKIIHTPYFPPEWEFNRAGQPEQPLFRRLEELNCPFYIDRLQGGMPLPRWYPFDPALIRHYRELLGERFWGFQMHEWASNYRSDCERIEQWYKKLGSTPANAQERYTLWERMRREGQICEAFDQDTYSGKKLLLEALDPEEWMAHRDSRNRTELLEDLQELYARRSRMMDGLLIPTDSFYMAPRLELRCGAKLLLPEVGWQIADMRIQMAYTRGMAKAANVRWGIYYECWGPTEGYGITIPFSLRRGQDEWQEDQLHIGNGADRTPEERERGGSSRSLQERAWRYAYLSGAQVIGEEYGVCNTFRDYEDFALSAYGEVKRDFLRFTERFPEVGQTFTPFAIVLPAQKQVLEIGSALGQPTQDLGFPVDADSGNLLQIRQTLSQLLGHAGRYGNHSHVIKNGGFPDVFDILHADQTEALAQYPYLIDLTGDPAFEKTHPNTVPVEQIDTILDQLLPCRIAGDVHSIYNRTDKDWLVLIANHDGIQCDHFAGDRQIPEAAAQVRLRISRGQPQILDKHCATAPQSIPDGLGMTLEAGEWVLLKLEKA